MKYSVLNQVWYDMCNHVVGCDTDGNPIGPLTAFGLIITSLGGSADYLTASHETRDALLSLAKAIDDVLPAEHQMMQGPPSNED